MNRVYLLICFFLTLTSCKNRDALNLKVQNQIELGQLQLNEYPDGLTAYRFFKEAENLYVQNRLNDTLLLGEIYRNIAKINLLVGNYNEANTYGEKRYSLNKSIESDSLNLSAQIDYSYINIALSNYDKARALIDELTSIYQQYPSLVNNILELEANYFEIIEDYDLAMEAYSAIVLGSKMDSVKAEYFFARNFYNANRIDSAVVRADNLIELLEGSRHRDSYLYYSLASKIYTSSGDIHRAEDILHKSEDLYSMDIEKAWSNKILELEVNYGNLENQQQILELKSLNYRLILISLMIVSATLILYLLLRIRHKRNKLKLEINIAKLKNIEHIKRVMEVSLEFLPSFQDEIYSLVAKNQKASSEIMSDYILISKEMKRKIKRRFEEVINESGITQMDPIFSKMDEYSTNEKMVIYLSFLGYNSSFIARVLQTSSGSIRGIKANIRKKTEDSNTFSLQERDSLLKLL